MSPSDSPREPPDRLKPPPLKLVPSASSCQVEDVPKHITCLAILPLGTDQSFDFYKEILQPALRIVFENSPYYWQVIASYTSDIATADGKEKNVSVYIVDISDENPEMLIELGGVLKSERGKAALIFALNRAGTKSRLLNRKDIQVLNYPYDQHAIKELEKVTRNPNDADHIIEDIVKALKQSFQREDIRRLNSTKRQHYLSPLILSGLTMDSQGAIACAELCESMEVFISMKAKDISTQLRNSWGLEVPSAIISGYQKAIRSLLKKL